MPDGPVDSEDFSADLASLKDHLGLEKAVLCGLSMGGHISLQTAVRCPNRVTICPKCSVRMKVITVLDANAAVRFASGQTGQVLIAGTLKKSELVVALSL